MDRQAFRHEKTWRKLLRADYTRLLNNMRAMPDFWRFPDYWITDNTAAYTEAITEQWMTVGDIFYTDMGRQLGRKQFSPSAMQRIRNFLIRYGLKQARQIEGTTHETVATIIADALERGLTIQQVAKELSRLIPGMSANRAITISRTETTAAANYSSLLSVEEIGMPFKKKWLAANQKRTRDWHKAAHGQTVAGNELFTVRGERLAFPGDSGNGATGMNIVNCRCSLSYIIDQNAI